MEDPQAFSSQLPPEAAFRLQLPSFEGPLDLLLHLIKKHELDILDLPIAFVTERYLAYLRTMQSIDLEVAGEYLLMAATLAHIKSKMLLPRTPADQQDEGDGVVESDPRLELIRRLLEYQKYKAVAEQLGERPVTGRDVFGRGGSADDVRGPIPLAEVGLFRLLDAFEGILARAKGRLAFGVTAERISISDRMTQITELLRERRACQFEELFAADVTRYEVVVTFLALLEMTKLRVIRVFQTDYRSPIHLHFALLDAEAPTLPPPSATTEAPSQSAARSDQEAR
ncbi:MAG: segregation and condensation protein A [Polyangiales bacterium]